jgi:vacuolar-type H+-ATPase subunit F/Vma7
MANSLVAIANGQTALELGLAGVRVEEVREPREAEKVLEGLLESDAQMVIVQEDFRGKFSEWFENRLARHGGLPLVIYCPAFEEEDAGTDAYINAIVRPAVGFEIRLDN